MSAEVQRWVGIAVGLITIIGTAGTIGATYFKVGEIDGRTQTMNVFLYRLVVRDCAARGVDVMDCEMPE